MYAVQISYTKVQIHENIFQLVYYGQGFTHDDIYCMPTYLRNFYSQQLLKVKKEEKKQIDKANKKPSSSVRRPNIPRR